MLKLFQKLIQSDYFLIFVLVSYSLHVLFQTGFNGDDSYNTQIAGRMIDDSVSLPEIILSQTRDWFLNNKRILLSYVFIFPVFYYFDSYLYVKAITIGFVFLSIALFYKFFYNTIKNKPFIFLVSFILLISIQLRNWHDPILIFPSHLLPYLTVIFFLSLLAFDKYLKNDKLIFLFISLFLFAWSIGSYEINIVLTPLYFLLCFLHKPNLVFVFKKSLGHIFIIFLYLIFYLIAALFLTELKNAYPTFSSFNFLLFAKAALIQFSSAFPFSYLFANYDSIKINLSFFDFIILFLSAVLLYRNLVRLEGYKIDKRKFNFLIFSSLVLSLFPVIPAALSSHQKEIISSGFGYGYITIYYQYFGIAIASSLLIYKFSNIVSNLYTKRIFFTILSIIFASLLILNTSVNKFVALQTNLAHKFPQELQSSAISNGLMSEIKENDYLVRSMRHANDWKWSYFKQLKIKFNICDFLNQNYSNGEINLVKFSDCFSKDTFKNINLSKDIFKFIPKKDVWFTSFNIDKVKGNNGQAFFGKINSIYTSKLTGNPLYIEGTVLKSYDQKKDSIFIHNKAVDVMTLLNHEGILRKVINLDYDDFLKKDIFTFNEGNIHSPEYSNDGVLQWVSGDFTINVYNEKSDTKTAKLSFNILNPGSQDFFVKVFDDSTEVLIKEIEIKDPSKQFISQIKIKNGINKLRLITTGKPINNGDPRNIIYGIHNLKLDIIND
tara:strand:- start:16024 stop:18183 length:2160 start_codon:yes stop_codon:yes gene_type:complete